MIIEHHALNDDLDKEIDAEDITAALLSVIGYTRQTLMLHPEKAPQMVKHLRSEGLRIREKLAA